MSNTAICETIDFSRKNPSRRRTTIYQKHDKNDKGLTRNQEVLTNYDDTSKISLMFEILGTGYKVVSTKKKILEHKKEVNVNKYNTNLFQKAGIMIMSFIPIEAQKAMANAKDEFSSEIIGNGKSLGAFALISSAITAVFNISFVFIVAIMLLLALMDWAVGIVPRPKGIPKSKKSDYTGFLDRLHMFGYLMMFFIFLSFCQVLMTLLIGYLDPNGLKAITKNYPVASKIIKETIGLHTLTALGIAGYYINRIRKPVQEIIFKKSPSKSSVKTSNVN